MKSNSTIDTQLAHRSIRRFSDDEVSPEVVQTLWEVGIHTPTSRGFQHASLVRITDPGIRKELATLSTQAYIAHAPELWILLVDTRRSVRILSELGGDIWPAASMDAFREGFTDAILMAQNMTVAAESLGLGVTLLGSVLNDIPQLIFALKLPRYTFPALGMMLGYPAQDPQLKPRIPVELRVMENTYQEPESCVDSLHDYDVAMTSYYDTRNMNQRVDAFTTQVLNNLHTDDLKDAYFDHVYAQGFGDPHGHL